MDNLANECEVDISR